MQDKRDKTPTDKLCTARRSTVSARIITEAVMDWEGPEDGEWLDFLAKGPFVPIDQALEDRLRSLLAEDEAKQQ